LQDDNSSDRFEEVSVDLEAGELAPMGRISSGFSRRSEDYALLRRDSMGTEGSGIRRNRRTSQKLYIVNEDLTIVVAGFRTTTIGFILYTTLCAITFGLVYLLLRWLPRWRVRLVGLQTSLCDSTWVVIEVREVCYERKSHILMDIEPMG
jgi:cation-transporting ATPase 13A2